MKKILSLIFSALLLFCSLSIFAGCGSIKYFQYQTLEIETEDGKSFIDYNGNRYFYKYEIEVRHYVDKYGLLFNEKQLVGKIYNSFLPASLVYVSDLDKESNVLYVEQSSMFSVRGCFVKEGVELPDIFTSSIENIIISLDFAEKPDGYMNESVYVPTLSPDTTYYDIVDKDSVAEVETDEFEIEFHGYLGIKGYEYLRVRYFAIFEIDNEICIAESWDVVEYYKVKPEYQEVFRNAMDQLDSMQAQ